VDVSANGFSLNINPEGVNMSNASEFDLSDMDYNMYAFTDSTQQHDDWTRHLEEALDQYRENMAKRNVVMKAKRDRLRRGLVREGGGGGGGGGGSVPTGSGPLDENEEPELIDLKFVS
jgi:hypothetical protein